MFPRLKASTSANYIFVGPTLNGVSPTFLPRFPIIPRPPVQRGDISAIVEDIESPGQLILADGAPGFELSVAPEEIVRAVSKGWRVWGVASTGAMLAARSTHLGMRGFGFVFRHFLMNHECNGDDIALLHSSEPPYTAFSEPLVHQQLLLEHLASHNVITHSSAVKILAGIRGDPLVDRTLGKLAQRLVFEGNLTDSQAYQAVEQIPRFRVKPHDLQKFIQSHFNGPRRTLR